MKNCIFCKFISGELPTHTIWEDENHLAFLTPFPNTEGVSVVIPKSHQDSYIFNVDDNTMLNLVEAAKKVALMLDAKLEDIGRTALVFRRFGINHLHAKLFPMHGTANMEKWKSINSDVDIYFDKYEGYISTHDAGRADDTYLENLANKIKS